MKKLIYTIVSAVAVMCMAQSAEGSDVSDRFGRKLRIFNAIVKELQTGYVDTLQADEIMDRTINTMLYQLDPYTVYYPANEQDELLMLTEGSYAGVGSMIQKRGKYILIGHPYYDSPARQAGLRHGDIIVAVDGDTVTAQTEISAVSRKLRGQAGTKVHVDIARPYVGPDSLMSFEIVRRDIITRPLKYSGVLEDSIGFIVLDQFSESAARDVKQAVQEMVRFDGLKGIVLDLRNNGGGLLEGAVQIAGLFVPKGTEILRTRGREVPERIYKTTQKPIAEDLPLVILVNGYSASASEIVAGAMQDLDRAVIVGSRTYGKGLVQGSRPLPNGGLLKLTTARYYIPSGRLIQALNYAERNEDGSPTRIPDSLTTAYSTAAGRIVRDGGGITPDIAVEVREMSNLSGRLIDEYKLYDYANKYANSRSEQPQEDAVLVDSVTYEEFKAFVKESGFNYDRRFERLLELFSTAVESEGYNDETVQELLTNLGTALHHDLDYDLELNREELIMLLDSEIGSRYFSDSVLEKRGVANDMVLKRAREILHNPEEYRATLTPEGR